jgi:lipopolysaccharide biosynthesis protein
MTVSSPKKSAIVTIVSNNYLHFARTMLQSFKKFHPDYARYCVIVDRDPEPSAAFAAEFEAIRLGQLNLPLGEEFLFQYDILELNTAVKPWAIEHLFECGHENVIYVDPDICFYSQMSDVEQLLATHADIVLTPHLLAPVADEKLPRELDIRRAGTYNFGFCALRRSSNTKNFLHWWQRKLTRDCVNDADRGLFVDQSWIDLVPGLFENVAVLRHMGYNVAYWNIAQRPIAIKHNNIYFVGNVSLVFFHFSGLDPANPETFSKHQDRFTLTTVGPAKMLVEDYVKSVKENGYDACAKFAYGFGSFSNGESIPNIFRGLYRVSNDLRERMAPHPFDCAVAVCDFSHEICIDGVSPTNAMLALWHERRDVQFEFPMNSASSVLAYYRWFTVLPTAATYYSPSIISHHLKVIARIDDQAQTQAKHAAAMAARRWSGNEKRAHSLYRHILGRTPDKSGFLAYSEMCRTEIGFVRAWGEIGLSTESKGKRFVWLRMLKALLVSALIQDKREINNNWPPASEAVLGARDIVGLFPIEADVLTLGVWVTDRVVIPISPRSNDRIKLEGFYFPESIQRQTGAIESTVSILVGGKEIHAVQLNAHGDFAIECLVPDLAGKDLTTLAVETSKVFVPKAIDLGDDERHLAWRLKFLSVGAKTIFDCARKETFPNEDSKPQPLSETTTNSGLPQLAYSGFFQTESESETMGVWVSANIVVPIIPIEGEKIHVSGVYFPESISKATGDGECVLRFVLAGKELHSVVLKLYGDFIVEFALPDMSEDASTSLHIHCNKSFVPKNIGEGNDDRLLSWRLKRLTVGRISVFDCGRQNVTTSNRRFVPRMTHNPDFSGSKVKLFAFYLPQYSHVKKDGLRGRAKPARWPEVSNAAPQYADHHQPQLPIELGFYDHRLSGVLQRQVALAKQYGITGFCFHHHAPSQSESADQPLNAFLADPSLDIKFCLCWSEEEFDPLLRRVTPPLEASTLFLNSVATAFADPRYQKVDLKPILILSNNPKLEDSNLVLQDLRNRACHMGLPGLYIIGSIPVNTEEPERLGFDAVINSISLEFDHRSREMTHEVDLTNSTFVGRILDYSELIELSTDGLVAGGIQPQPILPSWDNEPFKPGEGTSFIGATPEAYARWLTTTVSVNPQKHPTVQTVLIHAWNAWSEGAHLEADQRYGYGYLHATACVLLNQLGAQNVDLIEAINKSFVKRSNAVVIAHIYYDDLVDSVFDTYLTPAATMCDLIVTVMNNVSLESLKKIKRKFNNCYIVQTPNQGRDIRPFVIAYRLAHEFSYLYACKVHTKKSPQLNTGEAWRNQMLNSLLTPANSILSQMETNPSIGLVAPQGYLRDLSSVDMHTGNIHWLNILLTRLHKEKLIGEYAINFPAGSMYWFRVDALSQLLDENFISISEFELEAGQLDGTLAHSLERVIGLLPICNNYTVKTSDHITLTD